MRLRYSSVCQAIACRSTWNLGWRMSCAATASRGSSSTFLRRERVRFGVAISSFGSLKRLPRLNAIKIDASFIALSDSITYKLYRDRGEERALARA